MARFETRACNCEDYPCCGCGTDTILTVEDAIEAYYEQLDQLAEDCDGDCEACSVTDCDDRTCDCVSPTDRGQPDPVDDGALNDQLHDMMMEDRIGGTGYEY